MEEWQLQRELNIPVVRLLNDLGGLTRDLLLVLDDYHLIDAPEVHEGIAFLLNHRPPQLHVVLATRTDPPLPLARMQGCPVGPVGSSFPDTRRRKITYFLRSVRRRFHRTGYV